MKLIKRLLFAVIALVAILLIVALFVKKEYKVERSVTINQPKAQVFDYIKYIKNQNEFSV